LGWSCNGANIGCFGLNRIFKLLSSIFSNIYLVLSNNILLNNALIWLKLDHKLQLSARQWKVFSYNKNKTEQENAGFSHKADVQKAIDVLKLRFIDFITANIPPANNVLDFGCGPGVYLKLLSDRYKISGIDVSQAMIEKAKQVLPYGSFYCENFLLQEFTQKYTLIYSISTLEYVPVSKIKLFFKKCYDLLDEDGYLFIQYPHALKLGDLLYSDRNYISYSPERIEKYCSDFFIIKTHEQFFDNRKISRYDKTPYPTKSKDFRNGYLLIAQKRKSLL